MLIIIGNKNVIDFMINNTDSKKRNTGLEYKLRNYNKNSLLILLNTGLFGILFLTKYVKTNI